MRGVLPHHGLRTFLAVATAWGLVACDDSRRGLRGRAEAGYPAIGYLARVDSVGQLTFPCSGVLIAPGTVLTAAHCVGRPDIRKVGFGTGAPLESPFIYAVEVVIHPDWILAGLEAPVPHDLAVLRLGGSPAGVEPMAQVAGTPEMSCGYRMVGYGGASAGLDTERHSAAMCLAELDPDWAWYYPDFDAPDAGVACPGDSGGAVLDPSGKLVGIVSGSDLDCGVTTMSPRLDLEEAFVSGTTEQ